MGAAVSTGQLLLSGPSINVPAQTRLSFTLASPLSM
jgi:hypothetical protein